MTNFQDTFETRKRSFMIAFFNLRDCTFNSKHFRDFLKFQKILGLKSFGNSSHSLVTMTFRATCGEKKLPKREKVSKRFLEIVDRLLKENLHRCLFRFFVKRF